MKPALHANDQSPGAANAARLANRISGAMAGISFPVWQSEPNMTGLLRCLHAAGREELPFARLLEGHVDAVQLVLRLGQPQQIDHLSRILADNAVLGVWNADLPDAPLALRDGRLEGGKAFASGAGLTTHALVTLHAGDKDQVQLLLLDLARSPPEIDRSWWRVIGMQESETHCVRWNGARMDESCKIGEPGDYEAEPWFSGGALRFVAAQAGAVAALFDGVRDHLLKAGRAEAPEQLARLARLYRCADLSALIVRETGSRWFSAATDDARLAEVAHARMCVETFAEKALALAQKSVGVPALFETHPLSRTITDLMVYLRQPAPDAQLGKVGKAAADGLLVPDL